MNSRYRNLDGRWYCAVVPALVAAVIVLAVSGASDARQSDSVTVFHCAFGDDWDVNYDGWPDRWERKTGVDYPHYVNVAIHDDDEVESKKCLRIDLDGAAAALSSPPIPVLSRFSYVFEGRVKNEGLKYSTVALSVDFCDSTGRILQSAKAEPVATTNGWQNVQIGPIEPRDRSTDHAIIRLNVVRGSKGDLQGHVSLTDLWLDRLPRIDVVTNNPCNVYTERDGVSVRCELSGIREQDPEIDFQLLDGSNQVLQSEHARLKGQRITNKLGHASSEADKNTAPNGYEGSIDWKPKIPDYGFYRIAVRMSTGDRTAEGASSAHQIAPPRMVNLVVAPPLDMPKRGEFGWTLPDGDQPLSFQDLSRLLPQVGINWTKLPVWFDANDQQRGDELIRFVELLGASNIDVVGIVDRPPSKVKLGGRSVRDLSIADILSQDSATWSTALEPVMSRLALRVRWWQLGRDNDTSLISQPKLNKRIDDVRTSLFRFGQDVRLGLCGDWAASEANRGKVAWDFAQLSLPVEPSEKKFEELISKERTNSAQRWLSIEPPPAAGFQPSTGNAIVAAPLQSLMGGAAYAGPAWIQAANELPRQNELNRMSRSSAFVHRLVAAKLHGADAIIFAKPFDDENGLMSADGMPKELLLPWRTTAAMLGGAQYLGRLQLPNDSPNEVFLRPDGQVVMVVWNDRPVREALYLGDTVRQYDILGRSNLLGLHNHEQTVEVTSTPSFVLGLNEAVTRWRMNVKFATTEIPSIFSRPHHDELVFKNFFPQGVGGTVKVVVLQDQDAADSAEAKQDPAAASMALDRWTIEPPQSSFQLAAGGETKFPFDVKLKNALYGRQPIRIDFTVEADERLQFSAYSELEVGTKDLTLDVKSHLDKDGTLIVEQFMTNHDKRTADFKCHLRSKGYRPQRMQVYRLGPTVDRKVYRFPDGSDLVGKEMLLEIEEVNGQRVLKYRFVASDHVKEEQEPENEKSGAAGDARKEEATGSPPPPLAKLGS